MSVRGRTRWWAAPALAALLAACTTLRPETDLRAYRVEQAVVPMARAALAAGQVETARRLYTRLLDVAPDAVDARMGLGDVAFAASQPARAATWYLRAARVAEDPDARHAALLAHGRASITGGDLDAARASFERLLSPDESTDATNAAWGHNGLAVVAMLEGDPRGSLAAIERAMLLDPDEPRFRDNLARATAIADAHRSETGTPHSAPAATRVAHAEPAPTADAAAAPAEAAAPARVRQAPTALDSDLAPTAATLASFGGTVDSEPAAASPAGSGPAYADPSDDSPKLAPQGSLPDAAQEPVPLAATEPPPTPENTVAHEAPTDAGGEAESAAAIDDAAPRTPEPEQVAKAPPGVRLAVPGDTPADDSQPLTANSVAADAVPRNPPPEPSAAQLRRVAVAGFVVVGADGHYLQAGAFELEANARRLADRLSQVTDLPVVIEPPRDEPRRLHRVRIGPMPPADGLSLLVEALGSDAAVPAKRPAIMSGTGHKAVTAS